MIIILGVYAALVWLVFFRLKVLPWNLITKIAVSVVGLCILLTFMALLNTRTPTGQVTVTTRAGDVASVVGGTVTEILARIGIGSLTLVDGDHFDDSNLNRQLLSSTEVLGEQKAAVAEERVRAVNPAVETRAVSAFLTAENAPQLLSGADIAVDCLDSITARFTLESACRKMGIIMVSAAIGGTSGQLTVTYPEDQGLSRVYGPPEKAVHRGVEKTMGTLPFAAISLAAMECAEVVTMAVGNPAGLRNKLLITDLIDHSLEIVDLGPH